MRVKITKIGKFHTNQVSEMNVGDSITGEIDSWTNILLGHGVSLKDAVYEKIPKKKYGTILLVNNITEIINHNSFKTDFALYKIEEL